MLLFIFEHKYNKLEMESQYWTRTSLLITQKAIWCDHFFWLALIKAVMLNRLIKAIMLETFDKPIETAVLDEPFKAIMPRDA